MSENRYLARSLELIEQVRVLKQENEHSARTITMLENELRETEDAVMGMERDRDEQLEIVNTYGMTPIGELEEQIRWLKQRIAAKDEDFDFTSALADGYKVQRDELRAKRDGGADEIVDLTNEETTPDLSEMEPVTIPNLKPTPPGPHSPLDGAMFDGKGIMEDVVPFHKDASGKLVANGSVGIDFPNLRKEELAHISNLNADFRQAIEERDDARRDLTAYTLRTVALEEALARADADLKTFRDGAARGEVDEVGTLKQEIRDLEDDERNHTNEINDLVHVIADNAERENNANTVIKNFRKQVATLTIRTDELTFERDRMTTAYEKTDNARTKEGDLAARVITDLRARVESLTVQKAALTVDPENALKGQIGEDLFVSMTLKSESQKAAIVIISKERDDYRDRLNALNAEPAHGLIAEHRRTLEQLDEARRARDLAQLDRHNLTEKLKYWENVAPNTHPELIVSTLMEERDAAVVEMDRADGRTAAARAERDAAEAQIQTAVNELAVIAHDLLAIQAQRDAEAEAGREARNERETARRERDVLRGRAENLAKAVGNAQRERDTVVQERDEMAESFTFNVSCITELVSEVEQLNEELTAVRDQRDEKETIIEALNAERKQHGAPREQREWRQRVEFELSKAEDKIRELTGELDSSIRFRDEMGKVGMKDARESCETICSLKDERDALHEEIDGLHVRITTLDANEVEAEDRIAELGEDVDRLGEENTTLAFRLEDAAKVRKLGEEKVENLTNLLAVTDSKVAALRQKIDFIGEAGATTQHHLEMAEARVDELNGETETLTAALELAEEKLEGTKKALEGTEKALALVVAKLAARDKPEPGDDPDPEDDPNSPTGGGGGSGGSTGGHETQGPAGLREAIAARTDAMTHMRDERKPKWDGEVDGSPLKSAVAHGPDMKPLPGEALSATPRDKYEQGFTCRLGYDGDEGIYFDRTRPISIGTDVTELAFEQCDPEDVVIDLQSEIADLQVALDKQETKTADRLAEQRLLQRELRAETGKVITARLALADEKRRNAEPSIPDDFDGNADDDADDEQETDAEVRMMLGQYRRKFVELAKIRLEQETQLTEETNKSAHLRKRLHQAIKHIDDMTGALITGGPHPTRPEGLGSWLAGTLGEVQNDPQKVQNPGPNQTVIVEAASIDFSADADASNNVAEPFTVAGTFRGPDRHAVVATAMAVLKRAKSRVTRAAVTAVEAVSGPEPVANVIARAIVDFEEARGPESPADDDEAVTAVGHECGDGCAICDATEAGAPVEETGYIPLAERTAKTLRAGRELAANASACIQVWVAPTIPCPATKDGSHSFSNPATREGHSPLPPFCPQCHESFTRGPLPDPGDNPDVAYVTLKEAQRLTGA